ncbi:scavenger receptor class B member 1-like [Fopius arisanus]|uniref:Scavenger receptor class B member 1-like n=1 Tax=Fopius arisanus TaxID=64838 RepID=A0A9R1SVD7_9HYME|nr:PREDICTED: scavenger receptor class B member 1-like [Fopius arisanus]XP_011297797.1 PREDICTED: scavenger receptor class B member 1-like [Fopius arisanus]XP_011297800.1 PREDICTED: scavenger receptor class B member 1-like [Fopius arisanus]
MKTSAQLQQYKKCIILFMIGVISSAIAYALYAVDPTRLIFEYKLTMTPTSTVYLTWKKPPIGVYIKVYIFNITNPEAFLAGQEKLKVEEIGPYVYQEVLENTKVVWHDNGTISYTPKRTVYFVPEKSRSNPVDDIVNVPNVPMLGVSSAVHDQGFLVNYPLAQMANLLDSKPILTMPVYEYLWGYEDPLVRLAAGIVPNFINFRKFGLLDRMYDEGENVVNMNIQKSKNMLEENGRYLSIETYNGSPGLPHWGYTEPETNETIPGNTICNQIRGATEGTLFPTDIDRDVVFRVFRKAFCRVLPIVFKSESYEQGLRVFEYKFADDFLDPPEMNADNECYCRKMETCLKRGLSDLTPCYYNIPAAVSLPHFLDADPSLIEGVEGLNPDPEKHRTRIFIQPDVGAPLNVNSRIQTNLVMQHTVYNPRIKAFNGLVVPLFWSDLEISKDGNELISLMRLLLVIAPVVQTSVVYILAIVGITTFVLSLVGTLRLLNQQTEEYAEERRDSVDLRMPLGMGQYTAIHILPAIKKITSKTDLFG